MNGGQFDHQISGVVLARNEEHNIVECLTSLRPHVGELLLIDMESSDRTVELARPLVRTVLTHPQVPNFDAARNLAIAEARFDWLWFVDADERISARTGELVNRLLREWGEEFEGLSIPFKTYFCGQWMEHSGWWPGYTMPRVLKKGHFRFAERLHGGVELDGREHRLPADPELAVDHFSYLSVEHYLEKLNRYTSTEAQQLADAGHRWDWRAAFTQMIHDWWLYYEHNRGVRDGVHGWILAWLSGQYRWLSHAKLLDLAPLVPLPEGLPNAPVNLDDAVLLMEEELAALRARQPRLPLSILWRSPIWDYSGYADEGRTLAKALAAGPRPLAVEEIRWSDKTCPLVEADRVLLGALIGRRRGRCFAALTDCIPTLVAPERCAALNVLRTTFETDRMPADWLPPVARFDEVWVTSHHVARAFRRSWVPPEKLRVVNSCVDTQLFTPDGPAYRLPPRARDRFVFLSIFEWQLRKGWDVLLPAYVDEFAPDEGTALVLKVSRLHGQTMKHIRQSADRVLADCGTRLSQRPDVVLIDKTLGAEDLAGLYRAADAFVLASRGEGWGRPYMEAMASGLPTIGTAATGQLDFMDTTNSLLLPATEVPVSDEAVREVPTYAGHRWYEPDRKQLQSAMRRLYRSAALRKRLATRAVRHVRRHFDLAAGRKTLEDALAAAEANLVPAALPEARPDQVRVLWDGELFAGHSFSHVNEQVVLRLATDPAMHLSFLRRRYNPTSDDAHPLARRLLPLVNRPLPDHLQVVVRHAFPPDWNPPAGAAWVHIQPWEFGHLPVDWLEPLRDHVTEIWAPTEYVKRVYVQSGVPADKIQVIPWGVDEDVFRPDAPPVLLPTEKSFRFLFVGGIISRKGFDTLLAAYAEEFGADEDVCLVVKAMGSDSFYRFDHLRDDVLALRDDPKAPAVVYLEKTLTAGQLASLFTACHCLVAPYRGEGFGLPILEAMACGRPAIVPRGGASDDFCNGRNAFLVPSREVETTHQATLVGPPLVLQIDVRDMRKTMRQAFERRDATRRKGAAAAKTVQTRYLWQHTVTAMRERILSLAAAQPATAPSAPAELAALSADSVAACLSIRKADRALAATLARLTAFVDEIVVFDTGADEKAAAVAQEYGARIVPVDGKPPAPERTVRAAWWFWTATDQVLDEADISQIRAVVARQGEAVADVNLRLKHPPSARIDAPENQLRLMRRSPSQHGADDV